MKKFFLTLLFTFVLSVSAYANSENDYYRSYLEKCSKGNVSNYSLKEDVYIFESFKLDLTCLEKEFLSHLQNFPLESWANSNPVVFSDKIIRDNQIITENFPHQLTIISSLYAQKCGEQCEFSDEVIVTVGDKNWLIRGLNDKGIEANLINSEVMLIKNLMSTHTRNYIFNIKDHKFTSLPNGGLTFNKDHILVEGQKSYFNEMGAFWFDNKINFKGAIIELINNGNTCKNLTSFNQKIQQAMTLQNLSELCVNTY